MPATGIASKRQRFQSPIIRPGRPGTDQLDTALPTRGWRLVQPRTLLTMNSGSNGIARFEGVPLGQFRVVVVPASIGDSIEVAAVDSSTIRLVAADTNHTVVARLAIRGLMAAALPWDANVHGDLPAQSFRDTTSRWPQLGFDPAHPVPGGLLEQLATA
jgi:hypothetical protein